MTISVAIIWYGRATSSKRPAVCWQAAPLASAKSVLDYLVAIQEADGHWSQNSWLDGRPYWSGIQIDETGFPILLYDMLLRAGAIAPEQRAHYTAHDPRCRGLYRSQRTGDAAGSLGRG